MDHTKARELLELAALEPGGLDRIARAHPDTSVLSAHLADCDACRTELYALRDAATTIRDAVRTTLPPSLRARTLDYVASVGRQRAPDVEPLAAAPIPARARRWLLTWFPAFTAGVAVASLVVTLLVGGTVGSRLAEADALIAEQGTAVAGLARVTDWTLRLGADPAAARVRLEAPSAGAQAGTVLFSAASNELVMVASGLPAPSEGKEYRCWLESGGTRVPIGVMYRAGVLAYWAGQISQPIGAGGSQTFGVSLVASGSQGVSGEIVLIEAS